MSVRLKILIVIGLTFLVMMGMLYFTARWFLFQNTLDVEEKSMLRDVVRLQAALDDQIANMNINVGDWAPWDDTYAFIDSGDQSYVDSNIPGTFANLGIELMLFINNSGQIVYGKMIDMESGAELPIPQGLYNEIRPSGRLLNHQDAADKIAGILLLPEGPIIVASQPIVTSLREGPIRGALIMGRFLNETEIALLAQRTQLSISVFQYNAADLPDHVALARSSLLGENPVFVAPQSQAIFSGYILVNDIYQNPALILRVDTPRDTFALTKSNVRYLALALLTIGVVSCLVTMLLLDRLVIMRLTNLNTSVMKIDNLAITPSHVQANGNDEIFILATSINAMLDLLEITRAKQREIYDLVVAEQKVSERLLLNVLPPSIALRLKGRPEVMLDSFTEVIADSFAESTILFADVVEFTKFSDGVSAEVLISVLNEIFTLFDNIADRRGIEKIKTIGDTYMAAAGLPIPAADHTIRTAHMALDMLEALEDFNQQHGYTLKVRIGIDAGTVVAGVIGKRKFFYDVWGDVVNTASRMESYGVVGRIQVTDSVKQRLSETFLLEKRGIIDVKGKGEMHTWFLNGRQAQPVTYPEGVEKTDR